MKTMRILFFGDIKTMRILFNTSITKKIEEIEPFFFPLHGGGQF